MSLWFNYTSTEGSISAAKEEHKKVLVLILLDDNSNCVSLAAVCDSIIKCVMNRVVVELNCKATTNTVLLCNYDIRACNKMAICNESLMNVLPPGTVH